MRNGFTVIDAHCHIFPDKIAARAVAGTDRFYGEHAVCSGTVGELLTRGAAIGIDRYLVQSVATTPKQVKSINEFIASAVAAHPDLFIGFGTLHPDSEDPAGDVEHLISLGLRGVKLHPDIQGFKIDDYRCLKIYELCEGRLPILMHTGDYRYDNSNPNRLLPILNIYEGLTVIGAHFGGWSVWDEACDLLAGRKNLYVDTSSTFAYLDKTKVVELIRRYGADRVLWGADYPMWSPESELDAFLSLDLTDEEKRMILSENIRKLLSV